ncbi:MFS transporter [Streptomyces sp. NPDC056503]|uniref:MFS transporter n=1 Tax=Streptomyces sp. NPDC056503 TaxID=3345842 RepID=UPI0036AB00C0
MPLSPPLHGASAVPRYRDLLRTPEFTPLFLAGSAQVAGQTVAGLGIATLVFRATASPLLSALAMFGPSLAQLLGATTLLSAADRLAPRAALTIVAVVFAAGTAAQAVPGLPLGAAFGVLAVLGVVGSLGGGVRLGLLGEVLPRERYLIGRAVMNMAVGVWQIAGFAAGGVLLTVLSPRGTLLAGAALYLLAALLYRFGLTARPPRATGRPSAAETWRTNGLLLADRHRRLLYLALWVPNGLIVGCEALFVAYDPDRAGLLFACAAVGMLAGDTVVGRFVPARLRGRLAAPLQFLLAAPYALFAFGTGPHQAVAGAAVAVSAVGYGASLLYQERLLALVPEESSGHALGLHGSGMLACQGIAAALAGGLAQLTSPATAMALLAVASLAVTAVLTAGLSSAARPSPRTARRRTA